MSFLVAMKYGFQVAEYVAECERILTRTGLTHAVRRKEAANCHIEVFETDAPYSSKPATYVPQLQCVELLSRAVLIRDRAHQACRSFRILFTLYILGRMLI